MEHAHADHCDEHTCYACSASTGNAIPSNGNSATTQYRPGRTTLSEATLNTCGAFARPYNSRGPPHLS